MINNVSTCGLSEFANEVRGAPEEARAGYGVRLSWENGMRSRAEALPMRMGPHTVSRSFSWKIDEPRQLLGANHGPNPQELLLSGLAGCIMAAFVAGATARGAQIGALEIEIEGELDLHGFLGIAPGSAIGFREIRYRLGVEANASAETLEEIRTEAIAHSPNAMTIMNPVSLIGTIDVWDRDMNVTANAAE